MFIDIHMHISAISDIGWTPDSEGPASPEQFIEMYDEVGIDCGVMLPLTSPECNVLTQSNEDILMIAQQYPDRFIPFCNIDPRLSVNSPDFDLGWVIEHYKEKGCRGIGELTANLWWDDPRVTNLLDHAERCEMPVTFHVANREGNTYGLIDDFGLPRLEKQIADHPDLVFLAHSQAWWAFMSADVGEDEWGGYPDGPVVEGGRVPELMSRYPNIYGDLSAGSGFNAVSRDPEFGYDFLEQFQDRLCFGTDVCRPSNKNDVLINLKNFLEDALEGGKISQEAFDKITHRNAQRILKLED
ncbi:MAG: amidohydrolase family protein [Armatimonadota bacterium]|nr:amidohydrolase family protein [Armatimonadota bacterium]